MRIVRFDAENVKKLRVVSITPTGSVVQITGPNGSGKSSVLDAIFMALAGKSAAPSRPVRAGEEKATIRLDLGEIIVTRRFTAEGGTSLTVATVEGAKFPSPQAMLDGLLGTLAFDPFAFSRMTAKEQRAELGQLVGITDALSAFERQRAAAFVDRTNVNRDLKTVVAKRDASLPFGDRPTRIDVRFVMSEIKAAQSHNVERARIAHERSDVEQKIERLRTRASASRAEAARLTAQAVAEEEAADRGEALLTAMPEPAPMRDVAELQARIEDAEAINRTVGQFEEHDRLTTVVQDLEQQAASLTAAIDEIEAAKAKLVTDAQMPVEGLGFADDCVTYQGIPLDQASSAEQLRVSVAIAMAANPKLRVLRIKDGSLLDERSLALLGGMAEAHDYQVWIERVDTSGTVGIIMEDGTAREASAAPSTQTERLVGAGA